MYGQESIYLNRSWELCPSDVLYIILKHLGCKEVLLCREVCKTWKCSVDCFLMSDCTWKSFCEKGILDEGYSIAKKSTLSWQSIYRNVYLWQHIGEAFESKQFIEIPSNGLKGIYVYKDTLTLVHKNHVVIYNIEDLSVNKTLTECMEKYQDSDYITLKDFGKTIHLLGKNISSEELKKDALLVYNLDHVRLYRLYKNRFYVILHTGAIWVFKWNHNNWEKIFLARYYGNASDLCDMKETGNELYMLTKTGVIHKIYPDTKQMLKVCNVVARKHDSAVFSWSCQLIDKFSVAVLVAYTDHPTCGKETQIFGNYNTERRVDIVFCGGISLKEHCEVLLVGRIGHTIDVYSKRHLFQGNASVLRTFKYDYSLNTLWSGAQLYEAKDSHIILLQNSHGVMKIHFSYPSHVTDRLPPDKDLEENKIM